MDFSLYTAFDVMPSEFNLYPYTILSIEIHLNGNAASINEIGVSSNQYPSGN